MEKIGGLAQPLAYAPLPLLMGGGESTASTPPSAEEAAATRAPTFRDLLAIVNPLQHLPVVGPIYRHLTGDVPHPAAKVIGGMLFGGPVGLFGSAITAMVEQVTGKTSGEIVTAMFAPSQPAADATGGPGGAAAPLASPDAPAPAEAQPPQEKAAAPAAANQAAAKPAAAKPVAAAAEGPPAAAGSAATFTSAQRPTGGRDLAFYQTHAGGRVAAATSATAPGAGAPAGAQMPMRPRPAMPMLGAAPTGPAAGPAPTPTPAPTPMAIPLPVPPSGGADFAQRMLQGMERYQALSRAAMAAPRIDLSE